MFKKILIANRGEIAVRVIRACREMGIRSVAVYSDVDREALHVRKADESVPLGDPRPSESYLNIQKIIEAAGRSQADAIHPGYGFLSENARFARTCEEAGIVFIGPSSEVIHRMGDKIGARNFLKNQGVPLVPGTDKAVLDLDALQKVAKEVGYPVLLKAAAGGGGKGMRVVSKEGELAEALAGCQREAKGAFGDDRVFLEKYLLSPRHIEFQIVADHHGNVMHLFERECSIQRRHQKVIEETPSPRLDEGLRDEMGSVAVKIARAIGYRNAGTIEFILDQDGNFYFLEVNTRLQVEHPITEMVTGVDLVKTQIRIAALTPDPSPARREGRQRGHALECRIYAEDPENNFLPSPGKITHLREPVGEGIRVDSGVYEGWTVPCEYDPMLSKLIVHAPTRERAIVKMIEALGSYEIGGIGHNIPFLIDLLRHPAFLSGSTDTGLIGKYFKGWRPGRCDPVDPFSPWSLIPGPSPSPPSPVRPGRTPSPTGGEGRSARGDLTAPMPGQVTKIFVKEGDKVSRGDPLMVIEAMKMEHSICAPEDGTVKKVFRPVGVKVGMGEKLVEIS